MHRSDRSFGCLHLDRDRQLAELGRVLAALSVGQGHEPCAAVLQPVADVAGVVPAHVVVMVAAHRVEPGFLQPLQHLLAFWATVDQVTYREETIALRVELHLVERLLQQGEVAVDVADSEVTASGVDGEALNERGLAHAPASCTSSTSSGTSSSAPAG
ncbi:hypothetical protein D3C75_998230 [compost metagenome]